MLNPKTHLRNLARRFGLDVVSCNERRDVLRDIFWSLVVLRDESQVPLIERDFVEYCLANYKRSKSQIYQDLFVQFILRNKRDGFFVEFGATNGIDLSNSYILETEFGWNGILAEPARIWHDALRHNRKAKIDIRCVSSTTGDALEFNETGIPEFSTIGEYSARDMHAKNRSSGQKFLVDSVSLSDLLKCHNAPPEIDYLSIDTEGSEFLILSNFDFRTDIKIITVEHNYEKQDRERIHSLLASNGYRRLFERFSGWDDWYVKSALLEALLDAKRPR